MRYTIDFKNPNVILSVEESFTLGAVVAKG
jgi:hypothetical protein